MTISDQAIEAIKASNKAQAGLMVAFDKSHKTIENWLRKKDIKLTTKSAVEVIKDTTGLTEEQILKEETVSA